MRHLVFTAKWIGLRCVEHLLDIFPEDNYTFVICEPDADMVTDALDQRGFTYMRLGDDTLNVIRKMKEEHYDWLLNLWGGYIFKDDILSRARRSLNVHPAYLPYCRGRDPIVWAIRKGYPAGVSLHSITSGVDEGPIWYREQEPYELPIKGGVLYDRVVARCLKVFCEQWQRLRGGDVVAIPQSAPEDWYTFRRSDLLQDRSINADADIVARDVILRLLAHDFSPNYSAQIIVGGQVYNANLLLQDGKPKTQ